jgi:hypothetical protein
MLQANASLIFLVSCNTVQFELHSSWCLNFILAKLPAYALILPVTAAVCPVCPAENIEIQLKM